MLSFNYTEKFLDLQGVIIKKLENVDNNLIIHIELPITEHTCPTCGEKTSYVNDYRIRKIKDISAFGKNVILMYRRRRYICKHCGKAFSEINHFVPKYYRVTSRLVAYILKQLETEYSFTSVSKAVNLSISTIIRIFDVINYPHTYTLPKVLAIDEFKGNTGNEKYQCILTDPDNKTILDILPSRSTQYLINHFKQWNVDKRNKVSYFVSDMWQPYTDLASCFFKQSIQIIDKYHFIRQTIWAFEAVRKREQKKYGKHNRLSFKNSKRILTSRNAKLKDYQKERVNALLYISRDLSIAYRLKEDYYKILDQTNRDIAKEMMKEWIYSAQDSGLHEFIKCSNTMINWQNGILNSFTVPYTNGFTEGCNNKIKVLKRNAYGYRNFRRFRNRILHMFNYKNSITKKQAVA